MAYVGRDGRIHQNQPWSLDRLLGMFFGFFSFLWMFLRSLIDPITSGLANASNSDNSRRGGGGGGGFGGYRRGPPPGGPQRRTIGRINTLADCNIPGGG